MSTPQKGAVFGKAESKYGKDLTEKEWESNVQQSSTINIQYIEVVQFMYLLPRLREFLFFSPIFLVLNASVFGDHDQNESGWTDF